MHERHLRKATERAVRSIVRRALRRGHATSDLERRILSQMRRERIAADNPIADAELFRRIASRLGDAVLGASSSVAPGNETVRRQDQWTDTALAQ